ncbi:hypothetical protein M405DRAFT_898028 [Rhizopogon salebrosus TDB-379]|nr:hypothetical protein M405DRAFT_898028 [Rhizopogon salebrosus TDB-379]
MTHMQELTATNNNMIVYILACLSSPQNTKEYVKQWIGANFQKKITRRNPYGNLDATNCMLRKHHTMHPHRPSSHVSFPLGVPDHASSEALAESHSMKDGKQQHVAYRDPIRTFEGHQDSIFAMVTLPDGERITTTAIDKATRIRRLEDGMEMISGSHTCDLAKWNTRNRRCGR